MDAPPPMGRRIRNAAIPALVFGCSLAVAGAAIWYWLFSVEDTERGYALFLRLCLLGVSIGLAAFLCRMVAGARTARLGLLKPVAGDVGAIGWFLAYFGWGVQHAPAFEAGVPLTTKLMTWLRVGLIDSPLYVVFGFALVATLIFCLLDLGVRRWLRGRRESTSDSGE